MAANKSNSEKRSNRLPEVETERAEIGLTRLMITQRSMGTEAFLTVYRGTREELRGAGLPGIVLDRATSRRAFAFRMDGRVAEITHNGELFELTVHWSGHGPWYFSAGHPALKEISRMVRIDVGRWLRGAIPDRDYLRPVAQTEALLRDSRAVDYRQPRSRKYRLDHDQMMYVDEVVNLLCNSIVKLDIDLERPLLAVKPAVRRRPSPAKRAQLAVAAKADTGVQKLLTTAINQAARRQKRGGARDGSR